MSQPSQILGTSDLDQIRPNRAWSKFVEDFGLKSTVIRSPCTLLNLASEIMAKSAPLHIEASALHARRERVFLVLAGLFLGSLTMLNILGISRFVKCSLWGPTRPPGQLSPWA